jgi:hypothetical protein
MKSTPINPDRQLDQATAADRIADAVLPAGSQR